MVSDGHMALDELVAELGNVARGNDTPLLHDGEAGGGAAREGDVLFDEDHGEAQLAIEAQDHLLDLLDDRRLDPLRRLLQEPPPGLGGERARDRKLLLLPARQHAAGPFEILHEIGEELRHEVWYDAPAIRPGEGPQQDVVPDGEVWNDFAALGHVGEPRARAAE